MCRKLVYLVCGVAVLIMAGGVPAGAAPYIIVDNNGFQVPGTGKPQFGLGQPVSTAPGWARVDGIAQAGEENADTGGHGSTYRGYEGLNTTFQRTMFIARPGDTFKLKVWAAATPIGNLGTGGKFTYALYYDDGKYGTQHVFAANDVNIRAVGAWTQFTLNGTAPAGAAEHKIGISFQQQSFHVGDHNDRWCGFDDVQLWYMAPPVRAQNVAPKDETIYKSSSVTLKWAPGPNTPTSPTPKYIVYFAADDSNWGEVNSGGVVEANKGTQDANSKAFSGLVGGEDYYWRIDTRSGATTYRGNIWTFNVQPLGAWGPNPTTGYKYGSVVPTLSWNAGSNAIWGHRVFFDPNYNKVRDANTDPCNTALPYRAKLAVADTNWSPSESGLTPLDVNTYYYWRVDEVNKVSPSKVVTKGTVWNFRTAEVAGLGSLLVQEYDGIPGVAVANLTSAAIYPYSPTLTYQIPSFEFPPNGTENFGARIHGYLYVRTTGNYTFWVEADEAGELWLSTNDQPGNVSRIAYVTHPVGSRMWTTDPNQKSATIPLVRGNKYYIMGLLKDAYGSEHLAVAWQGPEQPNPPVNGNGDAIIPGKNLIPFTPTVSYGPNPTSGATDVARDVVLGWVPGPIAKKHDVYFGTNESAVTDANRGNKLGVLVKLDLASSLPTTTYDPCGEDLLDLSTTYYWRIDDVNAAVDPNIRKGDVWHFTTANYLVVDNFEEYSPSGDYPLPEAWVKYLAVAGELVCPTCDVHDQNFVHDGNHSMKCEYTGSGEVDAITGGDLAEGELPIGPDWTEQGVKALTLYFYGDPCNTVLPMYVQLNNGGNKKYYSDPNDLKRTGWHEWDIKLADFGVVLTNVTDVYLGFEGTGSGTVYFDGIRLYRPRCVPGLAKPAGDFDNDCDVDYNDLDIMTSMWLLQGAYGVTPAAPGDANLVSRYKFEHNLTDSNGVLHNNGKKSDANSTLGYSTDDPCNAADSCSINMKGRYVYDNNHGGTDPNFWKYTTDYVEVNNVTEGNDFTLMAWIKTSTDGNATDTGTRAYQGSGLIWSDVAGTGDDFILAVLGKKLAFATGADDSISSGDVVTGQWVNVAVVRKRISGEVRLYIKGKLDRLALHSNRNALIANHKIEIGGNSLDGHYYKGLIDDVRFYSRALSDAQVAYLAGLRGAFTEPSLNTLLSNTSVNMYSDEVVNFKDFADFANIWLTEQLWP